MKYAIKFIRGNLSRSILIWITFFICVFLIITSNILVDSISNFNNIKRQYQNTPYNITIKGTNWEVYDKIKSRKKIKNIGLKSFLGSSKNNKYNYQVWAVNSDELLSTSKIIKGRSFKNNDEIILENWVLDYFGIDKRINQDIKISYEYNGKNFEGNLKLVGIISDIPRNKKMGLKFVHRNIDKKRDKLVDIDIEYKRGIDFYSEIGDYERFGVKNDMIGINASSEEELNELLTDGLDFNSVLKSASFSFLSVFIVFSIINMSIKERIGMYSIFRAIGSKSGFIFRMIFSELSVLFLFSLPFSFLSGFLFSKFIMKKSSFVDTGFIYLHGEPADLGLYISKYQILVNILVVYIFIFLVSMSVYIKIKNVNIVDGIYRKEKSSVRGIRNTKVLRFERTRYFYALNIFKNYIKKDVVLISIMVLTLSMLSSYYLIIDFNDYIDREKEKMMVWEMYSYSDIKVVDSDKNLSRGISMSDFEKIKNIKGVKEVDSCKFLPGKIIQENSFKINNTYFNNINEDAKDGYWKEYSGVNKKMKLPLIKSSVRGYSDSAIKKIEKYKTKGSFDLGRLKQGNNAILIVPKTDSNNFKNLPRGKDVAEIKIGEEVSIYTPKNQDLDEKYYSIDDDLLKYNLESYKIIGIAYGSYFENARERTNPTINIVVDEEKFMKNYGIEDYRQLNVYADKNIDVDNLYAEIDNLFLGKQNILSRNVRSELDQMKKINDRKKIFNTSVLLILFLSVIFCSINNISSLFDVNKQDIVMVKEIGARNKTVLKLILIEGILISSFIVIMSFIISNLAQLYLYDFKGVYYEGIEYVYNYRKFFEASIFSGLVIIFYLLYKNRKLELR